MNSWPAAKFDERFQVVLANGEPASGYHYRLVRTDGTLIEGITDQSGMIDIQRGLAFEECLIEVLGQSGGVL